MTRPRDSRRLEITGALRRKAAHHIHSYEYSEERECGVYCDCATLANIAIDVIDAAMKSAKSGEGRK